MKKKRFFPFSLWEADFSLKEQYILSSLVFIGMVLRIINALYTPFWRDEIYIFFTAHTNTLWQLITQQHWDTAHPPLHSIFLHVWQMVSSNPVWLRVPSIITSFFILCFIPILAVKITKKHTFFPFTLLFLFSVSHTQISLNMVSRPYPFVLFLSVLSLIYILELYKRKTISFKKTYAFLLVNALGFSIDYSFVWLFFTYLFALVVQFFRNKEKRGVIIVLIQSLIGTAVVLIPVLILLFVNLPKSLQLEIQSGVKFVANPHTNTIQGESLTISFQKKDKPHFVVSNTKKLIDKEVLSVSPLFKGVQYLGFDIPPLTGIMINKLNYCASKTAECSVYRSFLSQLGESKLHSIVAKQIGSSLFLFNLHPKEWRSYLFPVSRESTMMNHSIQTSFVVIGYQPSAQILFASAPDGTLDYLDPSKTAAVTKLKSRNFHYEAVFSDLQKKSANVTLLESSTFLDTFRTDLLFFSGLPSYDHDLYVLLSFVFLSISICSLVGALKSDRSLTSILPISLFFIPIIASLCISTLISPIFVSRNLYVTSMGYLIGIALLIAQLLVKRGATRMLGIGFLLIFTYILFIKYPFLHYVDPPYGLDKMTKIILNNPKKKKIIIIDNISHYEPVFHYQLLLASQGRSAVAVVTLESFKRILKTLTIDEKAKKNYAYYFIRLNQNTNNFNGVAETLGCEIDELKMTYAFFANCHY